MAHISRVQWGGGPWAIWSRHLGSRLVDGDLAWASAVWHGAVRPWCWLDVLGMGLRCAVDVSYVWDGPLWAAESVIFLVSSSGWRGAVMA